MESATDATQTPSQIWRCKRCGMVLGVCSDTELHIAGGVVRQKIDLTHGCGFRNRWFPKKGEERQDA